MRPIERAARALQKAWDRNDTLPPLTFMDAEGEALVRAVLQAIREPSEGMKDAGGFTCFGSDNEVRWKVTKKDEREMCEGFASETYQAMIDAALAE